MKDLVITGFMGTGKTTVGRLVADRLGLDFVDLDVEIERRAGHAIADIFRMQGESAFRSLERDLLASLGPATGRVIATGGGTLVSDANHQLLRDDQEVVCLICSPDEIERRVAVGTRPMLDSGKESLRDLLSARAPAYARYRQVDVSGRTPEDAAYQIVEAYLAIPVSSYAFSHERSSVIHLAPGLHRKVGVTLNGKGAALVISDDTVQRLGLTDGVMSSLRSHGWTVHEETIPTGEKYKTLDTVGQLYERCLAAGLDRDGTIIGVGGGVVADVAGMVAATYMRGIDLVLAPTTLLAQVDAAIGGKVGVDVGGVKNAAGAFYPASIVLADPQALVTLTSRRRAEGIAEMIKIGFMRSRGLVARLERVASEDEIVEHPQTIRLAIEEKVRIVRDDPLELGSRGLLNFGHTLGHAIEAASGFALTHGEAVAIGMVAETQLGIREGTCSEATLSRLIKLLQQFHLPIDTTGLDHAQIVRFLQHDKKRRGGGYRVALPAQVGDGVMVAVTQESLEQAVGAIARVTA